MSHDTDPIPKVPETPGQEFLGHLIPCLEQQDIRGTAAHLDHLMDILETGRKAGKAARYQDSDNNTRQFITDSISQKNWGAEVDYATGTRGDRLYFKYDVNSQQGKLWMPYDPKADSGRISFYNIANMFGFESAGDPRIWNYTGIEGIEINFQFKSDGQVEIIPLDQ